MDTGGPRLLLTSNFTSEKIQDGGGRHFENSLKFGSDTKIDVPDTEIPPNFTSAKIQNGGRPPF